MIKLLNDIYGPRVLVELMCPYKVLKAFVFHIQSLQCLHGTYLGVWKHFVRVSSFPLRKTTLVASWLWHFLSIYTHISQANSCVLALTHFQKVSEPLWHSWFHLKCIRSTYMIFFLPGGADEFSYRSNDFTQPQHFQRRHRNSIINTYIEKVKKDIFIG